MLILKFSTNTFTLRRHVIYMYSTYVLAHSQFVSGSGVRLYLYAKTGKVKHNIEHLVSYIYL